jgi:hypothetical protein
MRLRALFVAAALAATALAPQVVVAAPVGANSRATQLVCTPGVWTQESANVLPSQQAGQLFGVTVASPTLAWAVGGFGAYSVNSGYQYGSLIEKWTGGTSWSVVGTGGTNAFLAAVTSFGVSHAVAVGEISVDLTDHALVTVWNGSTWGRTVLPLVAKSSRDELVAVSGSSANDVWAVGDYTIGKEPRVLLEHYNGSVWSRSAIPGGQQPLAAARGVVDLAANDVWVAGDGDQTGSLLWHYNGSTWAEAPAPPFMYGNGPPLVGTSDSDLNTLGLVGGDVDEHYNGSTWNQVGPINAAVIEDALAEGASGSTSLWTVGTVAVGAPEEERIYIAKNGVEVDTPNVAGILNGIGTGFGLAFAVGVSYTDPPQPVVMASCD